jgi:hypothetical protein
MSFLQEGEPDYLSVETTDWINLEETDFEVVRRLADLKGLNFSGQHVSGAHHVI